MNPTLRKTGFTLLAATRAELPGARAIAFTLAGANSRASPPRIRNKHNPVNTILILLAIFLGPAVAVAQNNVPDAQNYSGPAWSPYIVGAGIGMLVWLTMFFSNKPVGASSSYATAAGLIGKAIAPRHTAKLKYYQDNPPRVDWELIFVGAAIVGAFLAAWRGNELTQRWLPPMWAERFGEHSLWLRAIVALIGGVLMAFGARMARGCTSGHGISGAAQLNVASWIALVCFFIGAAVVANILFRV